jgi:predicted alpha/beta-hydrolase family hydrolase
MSREWRVAENGGPAMQGSLHEPDRAADEAIVLTHGAGSDRHSPLLVELAEAFASRGVLALRCDMPYRQARPKGPPSPSGAARDRAGLKHALDSLRGRAKRLYLGGSSYGGRQSTMLAAEEREVADALLLLSYPLHPPGKPERLRTEHFPNLATPCLFVHGSRDTFGTLEELGEALRLIPARHELLAVEGGTHGLAKKASPEAIVEAFLKLVRR